MPPVESLTLPRDTLRLTTFLWILPPFDRVSPTRAAACIGAASGELADTPEFREYLHREFPEQASEWNDPEGPPRSS